MYLRSASAPNTYRTKGAVGYQPRASLPPQRAGRDAVRFDNGTRKQRLIRRHHRWLKQFWTPTRKSYVGHSQLIVDSELRKAYEAHDPLLPEFLALAIQTFAEKELE